MNKELTEGTIRKYLLSLIFPVLWEAGFLISMFFTSGKLLLLCNTIFYLGILVYFLWIGQFSFRDLLKQCTKGRKFWIPVFLTALGFIAAYGLGSFLPLLFPGNESVMGMFRVTDWGSLVLFILSTIFLPPLAEELFFRQGIIRFDSKTATILTALAGILLFALEHSLKPVGILTAAIWSIPCVISYIKTKNISIVIMAHFLVNLICNGWDAVMVAVKLISGQ